MSDTNPAADPPEAETPPQRMHPPAADQDESDQDRVGDAPALRRRDAGEMMT